MTTDRYTIRRVMDGDHADRTGMDPVTLDTLR